MTFLKGWCQKRNMPNRCLTVSCIAFMAFTGASCRNASFPTEPTDLSQPTDAAVSPSEWIPPAPIASLWVYYRPSTLARYAVGSGFSFGVFAIHGDGVYEQVTSAVWTTSNPSVVRVATASGSLSAAGPGTATITATFQGFTDSVEVGVISEKERASYPKLQVGPPSNLGVDNTVAVRAIYNEDAIRWHEVQDGASWASSNPSVATVNGGLVTGVGQGNAEISVSYRGLSASARLSIVSAVDAVSLLPPHLQPDPGAPRTYPSGATITWTEGWGLRLVSAATGWFHFALVDQNNRVLSPQPWSPVKVYKPGGNHDFRSTVTLPPETTRVCSQLMLVTDLGARRTFRGACKSVV